MASINRVYAARLARMSVLGPMGESLGRVRDVVVSISIVRQQPPVLGLVVDLATRRSIFIPILRVAAVEPDAVTLNSGNVSLRCLCADSSCGSTWPASRRRCGWPRARSSRVNTCATSSKTCALCGPGYRNDEVCF